ncbi:hypothetical protein [uncultured Halomonas sp.]|uniref:hypothetical protein n=1 Tax=uncultured Halomonas sp. TaxID=173971 RepID=UPI00262DCD98|nr:hypothetical protein [uncultured Halomonas sp.]
MPASDWSETTILADWAEQECRHLDLIASWETLLTLYEVLGFMGPDNDEDRLAEFKQVIGELNKFLTRMKNGLKGTRDISDAIEFLAGHANTVDMNAVRTRATVAYNKMKQQWIAQSVSVLQMAQANNAEEGERDD